MALGYKESVNLAQIRTFTEMDSHEERVYEAMRKVSILHLICYTHICTCTTVYGRMYRMYTILTGY